MVDSFFEQGLARDPPKSSYNSNIQISGQNAPASNNGPKAGDMVDHPAPSPWGYGCMHMTFHVPKLLADATARVK